MEGYRKLRRLGQTEKSRVAQHSSNQTIKSKEPQ